MRLTGWILLLIGALACATIAWAAVGFLLMGVGLIALQVAERRRHQADVAPAAATGFAPPVVGAGLRPPVFEPVAQHGASPRLPRQMSWPATSSDPPYDREAWRRLVESDADLAGLANVLADYGPQYVDELAASYLAVPDKSRLGAIVDGIIARARDTQPALPPAPTEASGPPLPARPVIAPEDARPKAAPPPLPSNPADALEASLIAAVEASSQSANKGATKAAAERGDPPTSAGPGGSPAAPRGAFGRAARDPTPDRVPPPSPAGPSAALKASLIAAVTEAAATRGDPPQPAQPAKPPVKTAADDLDESLLAALAEISGQKNADGSRPEATSNDPTPPPADDELTEMIKKFAPDSHFLRKQ